jgi:hypothetical protein
MKVEIRQIDSDRLLEQIEVEVLGDRSFLVLQRRHRYRLRNGIYELASLALQVKTQRQPADARWWQGGWVIGDPSCTYNARTPLLRCAVLPEGPCERCAHYSRV